MLRGRFQLIRLVFKCPNPVVSSPEMQNSKLELELASISRWWWGLSGRAGARRWVVGSGKTKQVPDSAETCQLSQRYFLMTRISELRTFSSTATNQKAQMKIYARTRIWLRFIWLIVRLKMLCEFAFQILWRRIFQFWDFFILYILLLLPYLQELLNKVGISVKNSLRKVVVCTGRASIV